MQKLYEENYMTLLKDLKEDKNKWRDNMFMIGRQSIL